MSADDDSVFLQPGDVVAVAHSKDYVGYYQYIERLSWGRRFKDFRSGRNTALDENHYTALDENHFRRLIEEGRIGVVPPWMIAKLTLEGKLT